MPIALARGNGIGQPGFARGIGCATIYEWPEILPAGRKLDPAAASDGAESSSCSSSIGKNSARETESGGEDAGEGEVQSAPRGPLDTMDALEESLPIRRGISNFYCGKSKSFTSLADVASSFSSAKDLAKPENAYTRKHRNLLALKNTWHRPHSSSLRSTGGGISKRPVSSNRSTFALAIAMCNSGSGTTYGEEERDRRSLLPPLHPPGKPTAGFIPFGSSPPRRCTRPMRSFSLTDLRGIGGSSFSIGERDNHEGFS